MDTPVSPPNHERKPHEDHNVAEFLDENLRDLERSLSDIDHRVFDPENETKGLLRILHLCLPLLICFSS